MKTNDFNYLLIFKTFFLVLWQLNFAPILANTRIYPTDGEIKSYFSSIKNEDKGKLGYLKIANEFFHGNMRIAFMYTSRSVSEKTMQKLNWGKEFSGTTTEFKDTRLKVFDINENIKTEYLGQKGYQLYADRFYLGSMLKAYKNLSAVLTSTEFDKLNWGKQFAGTTTEFKDTRIKVFDINGNIKTEYIGQKGYQLYADHFYLGSMLKAYINLSAVLTSAEFDKLNWGKQFAGTTTEFKDTRIKVFDINENIKTEYLEQKGYQLYADRFYLGSMLKAYKNLSAVLTAAEFKKLNWGKQFSGTTTKFKDTRIKVFDINGNIKTEYLGQKGYQLYADHFYLGSMLKSYINLSAVLTASEFKKLNWGKQFSGTTTEFLSMREILRNGGFEIDYQKWFGKSAGLNEVVNEYMFRHGHTLPFKKEILNQVRRNFRAVVSESELKSLGWDSVNTTKFEQRNLSTKAQREKNNSKKNQIIDIKESIKRGLKK